MNRPLPREFASPPINRPIDESLVLWIEGRGSKNPITTPAFVNDLSGNGNHGTITGASWANTPLDHPCLSFDGVDDQIKCAHSASLETNNITYSAWIWSEADGLAPKGIVAKGGVANGDNLLYLSETDKKLSYVVGNGTTNYTASSNLAIPNQKWTHCVGIFDGSSVMVYIDGIFEKTTAFSGTKAASTAPIYIGAWMNDANAARRWFGKIDEVHIYNRALSYSEISNLYNNARHLYGM